MQSKCCKAEAKVIETENRNYYVCEKCHFWCHLNYEPVRLEKEDGAAKILEEKIN
jgi:hypothetical protein